MKFLNTSQFHSLMIVWLPENLLKITSHGESPSAAGHLAKCMIQRTCKFSRQAEFTGRPLAPCDRQKLGYTSAPLRRGFSVQDVSQFPEF
ncbi:conserved hypothetical protein [Escherichia coli]|nr:conserved hypothetical protein [Escherichia coli]